MPLYKVGDRVERIEDREVTGATVISIQDDNNQVTYEIEYDEGGSGWWPESCLKLIAD
jgi:hypothetical protein